MFRIEKGFYDETGLINELSNLVRMNILAFYPTTAHYMLQGYSMYYGMRKYINIVFDNFKYKHKKSFLNFYQKNQVKIFVSFNNPETVKEVSDYIEKKFNVKYSDEGTRKLL